MKTKKDILIAIISCGVLFFLSGCAEAYNVTNAGMAPIECPPQSGMYICALEHESYFKSSLKFQHQDNTLTIPLLSDKAAEFTNEDDLKYVVVGQALNFMVVREFFEQDQISTILINVNNGNQTRITGLPVLSPNKKKIAAASLDIEAGYQENGIEIYQILNDGTLELELKTSRFPADSGPYRLHWKSDNKLFTYLYYSELADSKGPEYIVFNYLNGVWKSR